ncbi:MAG: hypothetical protein II986_01640 [Alistipes sp.]|nr:hypothetical protein [Alistipes sp.]
MGLKEIKENLLQAAELVGDFEANGMEIDRDVALDKIRAAYESLRFLYEEAAHDTINKGDEDSEETEEGEEPEIEFEFVLPEQEDVEPEEEIVEEELLEEEVIEEEFAEEEVIEEELAEEEVIEEELTEEEVAEEAVEEIIEEELAEEPVTEEVEAEEIVEETATEEVEEPVTDEVEAEETAVEETAVEETEEVVTEEPKRVVAEPSLFGDDSLWGKASAPTQTQSKIMALYDDEEVAQPEPVAVPVVEPAAEVEEKIVVAPEAVVTYTEPAHQVLGEVIEAPTTIADTITPVESVAEVGSIDTLRGAISVVDRFMLIRDLFGDNEVLYEQTIDLLDKMDNLDDCIIYIAENFVWRPSSEGAKLIMDLLQRKFR